MDLFFGWTATALIAYLAGCDSLENDGIDVPSHNVPDHGSDIFASTCVQAFEQDVYPVFTSSPFPGGLPGTSPLPSSSLRCLAGLVLASPRSPLKRRARHQHGSPKRQKVSAEVYKSTSPSSTGTRKKRHGKSNPSRDLEPRVKIHRPQRTLSAQTTPVSHGETLPTSVTHTEDTWLYVQAVPHSTFGPASISPFTGTNSARGKPSPLIADNVMIGRKRSAPAEFDEEASMPHRKKYITGWMSEYIRLRASSWREMLRVMKEARWRPFRPQVIRYLSPAPPSAPLTALRYGCANPITGDLPVMTPTVFSAHRAETPSPSPFPPATTTPPYSPPESPSPFTPPCSLHMEVEAVTSPDAPTPPSGVAYSLTRSAQDCNDSSLSASRISWADKGKWRADASPEGVAYHLDPIAAEVSISTATATGLLPSLSPPTADAPLSSTTPTTSPYLHSLTLRTDPPPLPPLPPPSVPALPLLTLPPPPLAFPPLPVSQWTSTTRAPKRLKAIKRDRRFKTTQPDLHKMGHLRLRSEVKWRLKDLGFEKRATLPYLPAISTKPDQVYPVPVMIGPILALHWPASIFNSPSGPVVSTPRRTDWDDSTRLSVLASLDSPKRGYRLRRRRLTPDEPMEDVEWLGSPP
ncbi:hypothetical protein BDM02DRAFT_3272272 [Thelephora ganbajun]|uniref:Uncharacterized protein n=1 Tax=Thelephora ganbajun TaxID=370292 RepID=A0ACB6Z4I8_THEGA|nr:hypothetical protein BDM02DRAFT_3272272 [Thelephora ganbajun]